MKYLDGNQKEASYSNLPETHPLVSIIMLNYNGSQYLKDFFYYFKKNTVYPNYEIIVLDNGSTDDSMDILKKEAKKLPITVKENKKNVSFSKGNNQLAQYAHGEYILLLNNDTRPMHGWLTEMVKCALRHENAGAIGAKLVYPYSSDKSSKTKNAFLIQHAGIDIQKNGEIFKPYNMGKGLTFHDQAVNMEAARIAVTGAALLVKRELYWKVGGLDELYHYGYEDVDFCLKLIKHGYVNIYCPTASLFHVECGTQGKEKKRVLKQRRQENLRIFNDKWSYYLEQFTCKDNTHNNTGIRSECKIAIKVPVPNWNVATTWGDYHVAKALKKEFEALGYKTVIQVLPEWYDADNSEYNVAIVLRGARRYLPNSKHLNIMWNISHPDEVTVEEYNSYDYVFVASNIWAEKLKRLCDVPVEVMLQCTDPELFYHFPSKKFKTQLLFVGTSRKGNRKILKDLLPTKKQLRVYGNDWERFIDKKYYFGAYIPNHKLNRAYSSCKILLNDHTDAMREYGFISNRIFDGFASETFIISDKVKGVEKVFGDSLVTYETPDELKELINLYLSDKQLRKNKVEAVCNFVREHHTFQKRVKRFVEIIREHYQ